MRFRAPSSSVIGGKGGVVYFGMNGLMIFFFLKTPTGVVAAVGIKNGGMMKEEIRANTVNHPDITEMINIQKIILYMVEIPADTNRVGGILMTQRLSASVIDPKHQTMNVNHVTLIENVMKG